MVFQNDLMLIIFRSAEKETMYNLRTSDIIKYLKSIRRKAVRPFHMREQNIQQREGLNSFLKNEIISM